MIRNQGSELCALRTDPGAAGEKMIFMDKIQESVEKMKNIQCHILNFLEEGEDQEEFFQNIIQEIQDQKLSTDSHLLKTFLHMISKILNNHYRSPNFFSKMEKIIKYYQTEINENFSNKEIYKIFEESPKFLLFLFKEIIKLDDETLNIMTTRNISYLFPKIAIQLGIRSEIPANFYEKQKIGENEELISQLIRDDLIDEFITYVNQKDYSINSYINESFFETNDFLYKQDKTTLIEYAAFFGSTQIFKYLYKNDAKITSRIWLYAIHSDNPEMFQLLIENEIEPPNKTYEQCIKESIKCHHNDITNYILSNFINDDIENINNINFEQKYNENIYSYSFQYFNFAYFPSEMEHEIIFYYACQYDYIEIVEYFMKTKQIDIKKK